jgi:1,4-dihydroxy-2-naphthoate octaprenyltransferase
LKNIHFSIRLNDWRYSFIPQIFGLLYLWIFLSRIPFSILGFCLLVLSFITSVGFAASGYFINEYFDQHDDKVAGKANKITLLTDSQKLGLFLFTICIAAFPWMWLPYNFISVSLISIQLGLYFLYAAPPFRLKNDLIWAGIIDSLYAYVIPLLLSFVTFFLFGESEKYYPSLILSLSILFFVAGYRNLLIHHIHDAEGDKRLNKRTLISTLGEDRICTFLIAAVWVEFLLLVFICFQVYLLFPENFIFLSLLLLGLVILSIRFTATKTSKELILLPNHFYQYYLPIINLLNLIIAINWYWIIWMPIHLILLIPVFRYYPILSWWRRQEIAFHRFHIYLKQLISWIVNYSLFLLFLLIGVDLKKRKISAMGYIKNKFKRNN